MRRIIKLAALFILVAVLLSGCMNMDYSSLFSAMEQEAADAEATAAPTLGPMTEPVFTDREALFALYNEISIGDTLDDLTARYGEPVVLTDDNGSNYTWTDENGYGVTCVFFDNGYLRAKIISYKDIRQFMDLSQATGLDNFSSINQKHDFDMVCLALGGKPVELATIAKDSSVNPDVSRLFTWVDQEGSCVQVLFKADESVEQVSYSFVD